MYTKSRILSLLLLLWSVAAMAQYATSRPAHYMALSLGGGEANTFTSLVADDHILKDPIGGSALFNMAYELRKDRFLFGLGAGIDYTYTRQTVQSFSMPSAITDREGDNIIYTYRYSDYRDRQHVLSVGIPVYAGGYIGKYAYLLAGAKLSVAVLAKHHTTTMLSTDGTYSDLTEDGIIKNVSSYGYFPAEEFAARKDYAAPMLRIAPMVEAGVRLPLRSRRVEMRLGVYAEYHIPVSYTHDLPLVDYSQMPTTPPDEQTLQDMHNLLIFNPITNSYLQSKTWSQLTVGVKWTCLFNLTRQAYPCRCIEM